MNLEWEVSVGKVDLGIRGFKMDSPVKITANGVTLTETQGDAVMFALLYMCENIEMEILSDTASEMAKELYKQLYAVRKVVGTASNRDSLTGWQPIETAPVGESFLAYIKPNRYCIGSIEEDGFITSRGFIQAVKPSHWMHLNPPD